MLGEISPHHEYYDSKSSSETPPSYNQLNYNDNIQRWVGSAIIACAFKTVRGQILCLPSYTLISCGCSLVFKLINSIKLSIFYTLEAHWTIEKVFPIQNT